MGFVFVGGIMLHTLLYVFGSMSIGYLVYSMLYYKHNHALIRLQGGILSAVDLLIILAIVGLILSFIK